MAATLAAIRRVYPRVGGGNQPKRRSYERRFGLSPRGRGKPLSPLNGNERRRSIPAWAGETAFKLLSSLLHRVYPRVGGGNMRRYRMYPKMRGLSPRGRGKHPLRTLRNWRRWSIPAWAGETAPPHAATRRRMVYPRVGGGNRFCLPYGYLRLGLSPRGRGKLQNSALQPQILRSIPAWAGETATARLWASTATVYPRVGGGNHSGVRPRQSIDGLSPRGRGKRRPRAKSIPLIWSIPAWAGETFLLIKDGNHTSVYPRVGGGN